MDTPKADTPEVVATPDVQHASPSDIAHADERVRMATQRLAAHARDAVNAHLAPKLEALRAMQKARAELAAPPAAPPAAPITGLDALVVAVEALTEAVRGGPS